MQQQSPSTAKRVFKKERLKKSTFAQRNFGRIKKSHYYIKNGYLQGKVRENRERDLSESDISHGPFDMFFILNYINVISLRLEILEIHT